VIIRSAYRITAGIVLLAIPMILAGVSFAQSQMQTKPDEIERCRFSALDVYVEVKIEDQNSQPSGLSIKNFTIY
jgi:hypothetical protein